MNYRVITKKWDVQSPALVHEIISPVTKDRLYPSVFGSFTLKGSPLVEMSITDETIYKEFRAASKDFPKETCFLIVLPSHLSEKEVVEKKRELSCEAQRIVDKISQITGTEKALEIERSLKEELIPSLTDEYNFSVTEQNDLYELLFYAKTLNIDMQGLIDEGKKFVNPVHKGKLARKEFIDGIRRYLV